MSQISQPHFDEISKFIKSRAGIVIKPDRKYLVESRLAPVARENDFKSIGDLIVRLRNLGQQQLSLQVIDALTTNESSFFRDIQPFRLLTEKIIPELMEAPHRARSRRLRIWCAAASTGQEPYSIAMAVDQALKGKKPIQLDILGSDICQEAMEKGRSGLYTQFEVQRGVPIRVLAQYFQQVGSLWKICPDISAKVRWKTVNLMEDFSALGRFDIIFCRNVLIYFDQETRGDVLSRMSGNLLSDGYITLGSAETMVGICKDYVLSSEGSRGFYRQVSCQGAAVVNSN